MKYIAIITGTIVVSFGIYLFLWFYYNATDTKNVEVYGIVVDAESGKRLEDIPLVIESWRFTSDTGYSDYDSYLGSDTFRIKTNKEGAFIQEIPRSAFFYIKIDTLGYKKYKDATNNVTRKMQFEIALQKEDSGVIEIDEEPEIYFIEVDEKGNPIRNIDKNGNQIINPY